ncbi:MAG: hypothetical protein RIS70_1604 [Planctomycetota bacterium]
MSFHLARHGSPRERAAGHPMLPRHRCRSNQCNASRHPSRHPRRRQLASPSLGSIASTSCCACAANPLASKMCVSWNLTALARVRSLPARGGCLRFSIARSSIPRHTRLTRDGAAVVQNVCVLEFGSVSQSSQLAGSGWVSAVYFCAVVDSETHTFDPGRGRWRPKCVCLGICLTGMKAGERGGWS